MSRSHWRLGVIVGSLVLVGAAAAVACSDDATGRGPGRNGTGPGSSGDTTSGGAGGEAGVSNPRAKAVLTKMGDAGPVGDATVAGGIAEFEEVNGTTTLILKITGGQPGDHGVHIHANGSCAVVVGDAGNGPGTHWNPTNAEHANPLVAEGHLGDLGNITIGADGTGEIKFPSQRFKVVDGPESVVNHAIIYKTKHDDGTPPEGKAGAGVICGIIKKE